MAKEPARPRELSKPFVITGQLQHETNTFCRNATGVADFEAFVSHFGDADCRRAAVDCNLELGGFIEVAEAEGWVLKHTVAAVATPGGTQNTTKHNTQNAKFTHVESTHTHTHTKVKISPRPFPPPHC